MIGAIYAAIARVRRGEAPGDGYPTLADGQRSIVLVEATLRSARERRWVAVPATN
jgi:hypothetical protein